MATSGTDVASGTRQGSRRLCGRGTSADPGAVDPRWFGVAGVLAATLVAAVMLAGCGSDGQGSPEPTAGSTPGAVTPAASASPVPVDPVAAAEQAVLAAYRGMWQAYQQAGQPPQADPDHPDLERYAAGDALAVLTDGLTDYRDQGLVFSGAPVLSPEVAELSPPDDPAEATVEDCSDSSGFEVVRADGGPYEDEPGGRRLITAEVEKVGEGTWKVTSFAVREVGSC
jgi:hypothetical protein